jgi:hypothetical protein
MVLPGKTDSTLKSCGFGNALPFAFQESGCNRQGLTSEIFILWECSVTGVESLAFGRLLTPC